MEVSGKYIINKEGQLSQITIGRNMEKGEALQYVIRKSNGFVPN